MKKVERWKMEMPTEQEMLPKDKYSVFDRKVKRYRKGIHSTSRHDDMQNKRGVLMRSRGTEVDEGQPEAQPSRFLGVITTTKCNICHIPFASDTALHGTVNTFMFTTTTSQQTGCALYRRAHRPCHVLLEHF